MEEYIIDSFTRIEDNTNLEVNNLNVTCITSRNNKFNLDSEGNLTVKSIITADSNSPLEELVDLIYPIGSVYLSVNDLSPNTLFGGTWEQIKDKFLLASGDTYQNTTTGGEATHTLTVNELPQHTHIQKPHTHKQDSDTWYNKASDYDVRLAASSNGYYSCAGRSNYQTISATAINETTGEDEPHNNMPPYLVVNVWKRIA